MCALGRGARKPTTGALCYARPKGKRFLICAGWVVIGGVPTCWALWGGGVVTVCQSWGLLGNGRVSVWGSCLHPCFSAPSGFTPSTG